MLLYDVPYCSPFTTNVQPAVVDARKVTVSGVGIRPEGVPASLPISFKVDTRDAGPANLDVLVQVLLLTSLRLSSPMIRSTKHCHSTG